MTIPFLCVLAAVVVTYLSKLPVMRAMAQSGYDNHHPRDQQARLEGWAKRALAAHQNGFEIFPLFSASVFIAHLTQADAGWSAGLSVFFVISRICYVFFYLTDRASLRSLVWFAGVIACFALALLSTWKG